MIRPRSIKAAWSLKTSVAAYLFVDDMCAVVFMTSDRKRDISSRWNVDYIAREWSPGINGLSRRIGLRGDDIEGDDHLDVNSGFMTDVLIENFGERFLAESELPINNSAVHSKQGAIGILSGSRLPVCFVSLPMSFLGGGASLAQRAPASFKSVASEYGSTYRSNGSEKIDEKREAPIPPFYPMMAALFGVPMFLLGLKKDLAVWLVIPGFTLSAFGCGILLADLVMWRTASSVAKSQPI